MLDILVASKQDITAPIKDRVLKGSVKKYQLDFSAWAEDNVNLSSATWEVESGQASISNQSLSSNVVNANIGMPDSGKSLISVSATDGTLVKKVYLSIYAHDPDCEFNDYV